MTFKAAIFTVGLTFAILFGVCSALSVASFTPSAVETQLGVSR